MTQAEHNLHTALERSERRTRDEVHVVREGHGEWSAARLARSVARLKLMLWGLSPDALESIDNFHWATKTGDER